MKNYKYLADKQSYDGKTRYVLARIEKFLYSIEKSFVDYNLLELDHIYVLYNEKEDTKIVDEIKYTKWATTGKNTFSNLEDAIKHFIKKVFE